MLRDHLEDILIFWSMGWNDGLDDKMQAAAAALRSYDSMNQLIVKSFGSADKVRAYAGALRTATRNISSGDERDILKINPDNGDWSFGQENEPVARNDLWAVNPITVKHGYIAFDGRDVAETVSGDRAEIVLSVQDDLPDQRDLEELDIRSKKNRDNNRGWRFFMSLEMVCVEGDNKGAQVVYKPASMGGLKAIRVITEEIVRRFEDEDAVDHVPVVELDSRSYHNRTHGNEIFNPRLEIIEWASLEDETFQRKQEAREDDSKSTKRSTDKKASKGNGRRRDDDDEPRREAREARKTETARNGAKVDSRRDRDEDMRDAGEHDEDGRHVAERKEAGGGRRGNRDRDEAVEKAPADTRGRRGARDRDDDDRETKEDAPRGGRRRDDEDDRPARDNDAPRGRRAAAGGRR